MAQPPTKIVYTASATTSGGRQGNAVSSDGILEMTLAAPKELGGPGTGTNPEAQLSTVQELAEAAHRVCPYSKAIAGNVPVTVRAVAA